MFGIITGSAIKEGDRLESLAQKHIDLPDPWFDVFEQLNQAKSSQLKRILISESLKDFVLIHCRWQGLTDLWRSNVWRALFWSLVYKCQMITLDI